MPLTVRQLPGVAGILDEGSKRIRIVDVSLGESYEPGGEALAPRDCGMRQQILCVAALGGARGPSGLLALDYNFSTNKLLAFSGSEEVSAGADLSAHSVRLLVVGQ